MISQLQVKKALPYIIVWFIAACIAVSLRLFTFFHHIPFESSERATVYVLSNIRKSVLDSVEQKYPDLPADQKNKMIKHSLDTILKNEGKNIQAAIKKVSAEIGGDPSRITQGPYLLASDGYYYYSLTENIARTGSISESVKGSKYFNKLMLSPSGYWEPLNLHPYVGFFVSKIIKFFKPDIDLMFAVSFTPLFMTALILIPFIYLCYMLGCRPLPTMVGSALFVCASIFLKRSMFAWYDDDSYSVFFPLLILIFVLSGLKHRHRQRSRIIFGMITAATFTLYALFWHGWMFLLTTISLGGAVGALYCYFALKQKNESKLLLQFFAIIFLGTLAGITLIFGLHDFFILFAEGWKALNDFLSPQLAPWPNLYIGVGELEKPTLTYLIDLIGGYFYFLVALFGFVAYGLNVFKQHNRELTLQSFILGALFVITLYLAFGALRFALLAVMPTGIFCTIGLNVFYDRIRKFFEGFFANKRFGRTFGLCLVLFISLAIMAVSARLAYRKIPVLLNKIFNSTWEKALVKIRQETPQNSVVNTWWPPGHFIKAVAHRPVIFDGASINKPQGYWLANLFINDNETEALGILRMVNDSGNKAAEYLEENGFILSEAVKILKKITPLNEQKARAVLKPLLPEGKIDPLLQLTHADPPPVYILLYNDMIEKSLEFKFVGGWNFEKVERMVENKEFMKKLPPKNSVAYIQLLWDIAGGPYRYSGILGQLSQTGDVVTFEHNVSINLKSKNAFVSSQTYGKGVPQSVFYVENGNFIEKKLENPTLSYSVILTELDGIYEAALMDRPLAKSILMQMYFLDGAGLKYIRPFTKELDLTRRTRIYVYEVDWSKFLNDLNGDQ